MLLNLFCTSFSVPLQARRGGADMVPRFSIRFRSLYRIPRPPLVRLVCTLRVGSQAPRSVSTVVPLPSAAPFNIFDIHLVLGVITIRV